MTAPYEPDPDDAADDELAAEVAGQSTAEEAMDAVTDEDGHADESAYTPTRGLQKQTEPKEDDFR